MPDKKISELTAASPLVGDELVPIVQGAGTKKATARDVSKFGYQDIGAGSAATRTLALTDIGVWMREAVACTVTVPLNATVAFPVGITLNGIQAGVGQIIISAASGVTVNKPDGYSYKTRAKGSPWCLIKISADEWDLVGDLEATV